MSSNFDRVIEQAKGLAKRGDRLAAMQLANRIVEEYPKEFESFLLRSYLYGLDKNFAFAIQDLSMAIDINSMEPHVFYNRGRYLFYLDDNAAAIKDFGRALELCHVYNNDYYRAELHFWRAEALARLGLKHDALEDLAEVPDDFQTWTYALRTKGELLEECKY